MMQSMKRLTWSTVAIAFLAMQGCSSDNSGGSSSGDLNATSISETSDLLSSLDELLADESTSGSTKLLSQKGEVGDFSPAGCQYQQEVARARQELGRIHVPLCFIGAAEDSGALTLPQDSYEVFKVVAPPGEDEEENEDFLIRMGVFTVDGKKSLKFQTCKKGQQKEHFKISEIDGGISVATQHKYEDTFDSMTFSGANSIAIIAKGTKESLDSASLEARFSGGDGNFNHKGHVDFDHSKTDGDKILGCFDGDGDFSHSGCSCTVASGSDGATHVKGTDTFPAFSNPFDGKKYCPAGFNQPPVETLDDICTMTYDGQQAFSLASGTPLIVDSATSSFIDAVADCDLDQEPANPSEFEESWDCSGDATIIDFTNVDADECIALEEKKQAAEEKLQDNCFAQEQEQEQGNV